MSFIDTIRLCAEKTLNYEDTKTQSITPYTFVSLCLCVFVVLYFRRAPKTLILIGVGGIEIGDLQDGLAGQSVQAQPAQALQQDGGLSAQVRIELRQNCWLQIRVQEQTRDAEAIAKERQPAIVEFQQSFQCHLMLARASSAFSADAPRIGKGR
ncbi:MAG: hypothetical protein ACTHK7_19240, partial [Aureliella sp.]